MKLKLIFASFFMSISMAFAHNTETFQYNEKQINDQFAGLNQIESYVNAHEGITLAETKTQNPEILQNTNLLENSATASPFEYGRNMPLVGAFWWGCCLGIVGLLLTYIMTDSDSVQVKAAFWQGC